jgi:2-dehydropantoate 2-reductase
MKIAILGAGTIGTYVGGALLAAQSDVILIGRARMHESIRRHGVHLSDLHGHKVALRPDQVPYSEDPAALADADLILVTVKSADTVTAAQAIRSFARPEALVLSLQNGIGNARTLQEVLGGWTVLGGMVPFNVVQLQGGCLHRGTEGELATELHAALAAWQPLFHAAHLPLIQHADFASVQWGKLLLNLNNPVNALSGLPLKTELSQRAFRRCLALLIDEARAILHRAGIRPAKVARIGPRWLPTLLRLPDPLFTRIAATMLKIDPQARSSTWEDLQAGRRTEVDYLNGAVVKLAESIGMDAPANRAIVGLIRTAEQGDATAMSGDDLYDALQRGR